MKIDFKKYADAHESKVIKGKDGTEITVRDHIPYEQKVKMAQEMVEEIVMIHDDSCTYESHLENAIRAMKILEYYTDAETEGADAIEVADFMINNEILREIEEYSYRDLDEVDDLYRYLKFSVVVTFDDDRSLHKAIRTSFGFLFNGEDVTESLAKAEATQETIYKAVGALREKEEEERSKVQDGKMLVGGNILSFTKRDI